MPKIDDLIKNFSQYLKAAIDKDPAIQSDMTDILDEDITDKEKVPTSYLNVLNFYIETFFEWQRIEENFLLPGSNSQGTSQKGKIKKIDDLISLLKAFPNPLADKIEAGYIYKDLLEKLQSTIDLTISPSVILLGKDGMINSINDLLKLIEIVPIHARKEFLENLETKWQDSEDSYDHPSLLHAFGHKKPRIIRSITDLVKLLKKLQQLGGLESFITKWQKQILDFDLETGTIDSINDFSQLLETLSQHANANKKTFLKNLTDKWENSKNPYKLLVLHIFGSKKISIITDLVQLLKKLPSLGLESFITKWQKQILDFGSDTMTIGNINDLLWLLEKLQEPDRESLVENWQDKIFDSKTKIIENIDDLLLLINKLKNGKSPKIINIIINQQNRIFDPQAAIIKDVVDLSRLINNLEGIKSPTNTNIIDIIAKQQDKIFDQKEPEKAIIKNADDLYSFLKNVSENDRKYLVENWQNKIFDQKDSKKAIIKNKDALWLLMYNVPIITMVDIIENQQDKIFNPNTGIITNENDLSLLIKTLFDILIPQIDTLKPQTEEKEKLKSKIINIVAKQQDNIFDQKGPEKAIIKNADDLYSFLKKVSENDRKYLVENWQNKIFDPNAAIIKNVGELLTLIKTLFQILPQKTEEKEELELEIIDIVAKQQDNIFDQKEPGKAIIKNADDLYSFLGNFSINHRESLVEKWQNKIFDPNAAIIKNVGDLLLLIGDPTISIPIRTMINIIKNQQNKIFDPNAAIIKNVGELLTLIKTLFQILPQKTEEKEELELEIIDIVAKQQDNIFDQKEPGKAIIKNADDLYSFLGNFSINHRESLVGKWQNKIFDQKAAIIKDVGDLLLLIKKWEGEKSFIIDIIIKQQNKIFDQKDPEKAIIKNVSDLSSLLKTLVDILPPQTDERKKLELEIINIVAKQQDKIFDPNAKIFKNVGDLNLFVKNIITNTSPALGEKLITTLQNKIFDPQTDIIKDVKDLNLFVNNIINKISPAFGEKLITTLQYKIFDKKTGIIKHVDELNSFVNNIINKISKEFGKNLKATFEKQLSSQPKIKEKIEVKKPGSEKKKEPIEEIIKI